MLIDSIKTGNRVEIAYKFQPVGTKPYSSTVEAVIDNKKILLHAPISAGAIVRLPKEEQYTLRFMSDKGIYRFNAKINDYLKVDGFQILSFSLLDNGERVQNRNFFRFTCSIPTGFSVVQQDPDSNEEPAQYEGVIRDLGGGGMKMMSRHSIEKKSLISVVLQLEKEKILAFGEVVHKVYNPNAPIQFQYGIKFAAMPKTDQEKIVQYLSNEQRKLLQRAR